MIKFRTLLFAGVASIVAAAAVFAADTNVTGTWNLNVETPRGAQESSMVLAQDGGTVTGTYKDQRGETPVTGTVQGNTLDLSYKMAREGSEMEIKYTATVEGETMSGKVNYGQMAEGTFTGKKQK